MLSRRSKQRHPELSATIALLLIYVLLGYVLPFLAVISALKGGTLLLFPLFHTGKP